MSEFFLFTQKIFQINIFTPERIPIQYINFLHNYKNYNKYSFCFAEPEPSVAVGDVVDATALNSGDPHALMEEDASAGVPALQRPFARTLAHIRSTIGRSASPSLERTSQHQQLHEKERSGTPTRFEQRQTATLALSTQPSSLNPQLHSSAALATGFSLPDTSLPPQASSSMQHTLRLPFASSSSQERNTFPPVLRLQAPYQRAPIPATLQSNTSEAPPLFSASANTLQQNPTVSAVLPQLHPFAHAAPLSSGPPASVSAASPPTLGHFSFVAAAQRLGSSQVAPPFSSMPFIAAPIDSAHVSSHFASAFPVPITQLQQTTKPTHISSLNSAAYQSTLLPSTMNQQQPYESQALRDRVHCEQLVTSAVNTITGPIMDSLIDVALEYIIIVLLFHNFHD